MAKAVHGEYGAFTTKNTVRYQKDNKLISEKAIPPEVVALLNKQLGYTPKEEPKAPGFPPPTEEQKAQLRAESLQVPENLQRTDEEMALAASDFEEQPELTEEALRVVEEMMEPAPQDATGTPLPRTTAPLRPTVDPVGQIDPDFLESVSIHTAPIDSIARALYERFGLYSVYLGQLPEADEINPLTGEVFTKYHLGIAYQAAIRVQNRGIPLAAEDGRKAIDDGREASANFKDTFVPIPQTMADARRADSFEYRTSPQGTRSIATTEVTHETDENGVVHAVQREIPEGETGKFNGARARYDKEEEEPLVEPNFGGKPIIRPNW